MVSLGVDAKIKSIIEGSDTRAGRAFDIFIQILIVISILSFCFETLPNLQPRIKQRLETLESIIVFIFTLEYLLRIFVAEKKPDYIFSFYGLADLAAIIPFYISLGLDLRSLRVFRLLTLFRIFKLARYNQAIQRFYRAFFIVKEEMALFGTVTLMLLFLSAVGIYYFENDAQPEQFKSVFHSFWWAIATLTTVGYGDVYPITPGGRLFTFFVLMIGLGVVAAPAGLIASAFSQIRLEETEGKK